MGLILLKSWRSGRRRGLASVKWGERMDLEEVVHVEGSESSGASQPVPVRPGRRSGAYSTTLTIGCVDSVR